MSRKEFGTLVVVDDDAAYRNTAALMLRAIGFEDIKLYENGFDAIEAIEYDKPDLVISDWDMPILTGIDLLMCMRDDPDLKAVPFILNTGHLDEECWKEAIEYGVTEFLFKPFGFQDFKESVLLAMDLADDDRRLRVLEEKLAS
jgi:two-component system sensor histidine kinase/response regulator